VEGARSSVGPPGKRPSAIAKPGALRQALLRLAAFAGAARLADPTEQLRWGIFNRAGVVLIATNQNEDRKIGGEGKIT
jgi:hypothetical protein